MKMTTKATFSSGDYAMMQRALLLAQKGHTSPNPKVGCVIAAGTKILGEGYHSRAGMPHAEIEALRDAQKKKNDIKNVTLYLTLEPCCHTNKRTPPCIQPLIQSGIKKLVVAMRDPNPEVNGKGIRLLKAAGIQIKEGLMEEQARAMNKTYIYWITKGRPYVILKEAMTLDGKIATLKGKKESVSCKESFAYVQKLRSSVDAILVGIGTVEKDDPYLTARVPNAKDPRRIIIDSTLKIKEKAHVLNDNNVVIFTSKACDQEKYERLTKKGIKIIKVKKKTKGYISLHAVMKELAQYEIQSVLIEGGAKITASALREEIVNTVRFFIAPKIIGNEAISGVGNLEHKSLNDAITFTNTSWTPSGVDMLFKGDVVYKK